MQLDRGHEQRVDGEEGDRGGKLEPDEGSRVPRTSALERVPDAQRSEGDDKEQGRDPGVGRVVIDFDAESTAREEIGHGLEKGDGDDDAGGDGGAGEEHADGDRAGADDLARSDDEAERGAALGADGRAEASEVEATGGAARGGGIDKAEKELVGG